MQNTSTSCTDFAAQLKAASGSARIIEGEPMSAHTTFKVGGPAQWFVEPSAKEQIEAVVALCRKAGIPFYVIGQGSNVLVDDAGLAGVVIHLGEAFSQIEISGTVVRVQAGATNKQVSNAARAAGLTGYEFACGIPGSIGGAAIMNAGAYDGQFCDVAREVTCLTPAGDVVVVSARQAQWSYRHSMMMDVGYVVLDATLVLQQSTSENVSEIIADLTSRRESKQPLELPSAGSTFKRPEGYFAAKLIQDAGCQGLQIGGAQVSKKHAGFIVNTGGATAADIKALIAEVQQRVFDYAGVRLEPEVRML